MAICRASLLQRGDARPGQPATAGKQGAAWQIAARARCLACSNPNGVPGHQQLLIVGTGMLREKDISECRKDMSTDGQSGCPGGARVAGRNVVGDSMQALLCLPCRCVRGRIPYLSPGSVILDAASRDAGQVFGDLERDAVHVGLLRVSVRPINVIIHRSSLECQAACYWSAFVWNAGEASADCAGVYSSIASCAGSALERRVVIQER